MKAKFNKEFQTITRTSYVLALLGILGVLAFMTAILIAWPAFSYIAAKLF